MNSALSFVVLKILLPVSFPGYRTNTSFCLQLFDLLFVSEKLSCVHD